MTGRRKRGEEVPRRSPSVVEERLAVIREHFPEAMSEGRVDFERLRAALGEVVDDAPERYSFSWAGKRDAIRLLQTPSAATLVPCAEESIAFETTRNLFIEGDNLEVLKLLYKPYFGRVKMIYIDPPYNTGNDFIYPDNYADPLDTYLRLTGQKDAEGNLLTSNPETSGRYHSAWLSMMYPRLFLARQLLREDGVIFVSIDDHEVHNLRLLMNEVFGEENFVATVIWQKVYSPKNTARQFSDDHDYMVVYARSAETWRPRLLPRTAQADARYANPDNDPRGAWKPSDMTARNYYSQGQYEVTGPTGRRFRAPLGRYWVVSEASFLEMDRDNRIWWGDGSDSMPQQKRFLADVQPGMVPQTFWPYSDVGHTQEAKKELLESVAFQGTGNVLNTVKPTRLVRRILQLATGPEGGDIVVDFFAGGASTADAVLQQNREDGGNRRFICVQLPEPLPAPEPGLSTIADIGKERMRRVIGRMREEDEGKLDLDMRDTPEDLGFRVFKLAPSHYRPWEGVEGETAEAYSEQMALFTDPLELGWTAEGLIWEVALREGYGLDSRLERLTGVGSNGVYTVADAEREQSFTICLDDQLQPETVSALGLSKEQVLVCRETALDDELAANLALQCRLKVI